MHAKWADVVGQQQAGSKEAKGIIGAAGIVQGEARTAVGPAGAAVEGSEGTRHGRVDLCGSFLPPVQLC